MKEYITKQQEVKEIDRITCDKCDKLINEYHGDHATLQFHAGYGSPFDGDLWEVDLCEDCYWALFTPIMGFKPDPSEYGDTKKTPGLIKSIFRGIPEF